MERKETERIHPNASEQMFQAIFMVMDEGAVLQNNSGVVVAANPAAENILGFAATHLIGRSAAECAQMLGFIHEDGAPFPWEFHPAMLTLRTGEPQRNVLVGAHRPNGTLVWVSINAQPLVSNGESAPYAVVTTFRDVTEHKRIEDALSFVAQRGWMAGAENFFAALAQYLGDTLGVDYVVIDRLDEDPSIAQTVALYANGAIVPNLRYKLKGTPCENVMGRGFCCYPQGVQQLFPEDNLLVEMGAESYAGLPLWDSAAQPIGLIAVMDGKPLRDEIQVSQILQFMASRAAAELERERSDSILRASEREFRTLAENAPDNIARYDRAGRTLYANPHMLETLGLATAAGLIGKTPSERRPNEDSSRYEEMLKQVVAEDAALTCDITLPDTGDGPRHHSIHIVPEHNDAGEVIGALAIGRDISERKQAEMERERLTRILEESVDYVGMGDMDGNLAYHNRAARRMVGLPEDADFSGMHFSDMHPEWVTKLIRETAIPDVLEHGVWRGEIALLHRNGREIPVQQTIMLHRDSAGKPMCMSTIMQDITERKRVERERQSHAYSLECLDQVNQAILRATDLEQMMSDVLDVVLSTFDCDRAFLVYHCDPDAAERQVPMERTRPEYPGALALGKATPMTKEVARMSRITLDSADPVMFGPGAEYPIPPIISEPFGVKSIMLMTLHPKLDKPWQFGIHQCSHAKIWTEDEVELFQKIGWRLSDALTSILAYRNLRDSEQNYRTLAENMPLILVRYDREGYRTYVNPATERNFGVLAVDMVGKTLEETNPMSMTETYRRALQHTLTTGERSEFELELPLASGDVRTGSILIAPELAADGQISGAISIGRDISKLKQAEQQLREFTAHLQAAREEEKAHLAREIHDDLGGTLAALKIEAHFLRRDLSADPQQHAQVERVESMLQLLDNTIACTRRITTDLRPTILDTLGLLPALQWQAEQFHRHTGIECRVDCISSGNSNCNGYDRCDGCHKQLGNALSITLFRIFQETLTNVSRHSGASRVETGLLFDNNEVILTVSDNGHGLPEGHVIAVTSYGIRGMRERIELLGGEIGFDSPLNGGLRVTVRLPLPVGISGKA